MFAAGTPLIEANFPAAKTWSPRARTVAGAAPFAKTSHLNPSHRAIEPEPVRGIETGRVWPQTKRRRLSSAVTSTVGRPEIGLKRLSQYPPSVEAASPFK